MKKLLEELFLPGWRVFARHVEKVRGIARKQKVSQSEALRRIIDAYEV